MMKFDITRKLEFHRTFIGHPLTASKVLQDLSDGINDNINKYNFVDILSWNFKIYITHWNFVFQMTKALYYKTTHTHTPRKEPFRLFPGSPVVKESACQSRGHRFRACSRKIPYATVQLSLCTTATWVCTLGRSCALQQSKPQQQEAHTPQLESNPCSLQLEKACVQQQRPNRAKKNNNNNKF